MKRRNRKSCIPILELLERRQLLSVSAQHVLILSVDGLHQADVADPQLQGDLPTISALSQAGVNYTNASASRPSDSFPGTLSYLTGAGPGTTGVFYDDSYSRTLLPSIAQGGGSTPGTEVTYFEAIDKNPALISGGGNFDASSIDPNQLPRDPNTGLPVYPNQFLPVNTIYDVAHAAGLYTALAEKHPAYQIAAGSDPHSINDFYGPEINSTTALYDPIAGHTVDAKALLAANPFTDVSKYILVDASTDPAGAADPNLINDTTHNLLLTERYDDLKVQAILNEIAGNASHASPGITSPKAPNLFDMNFQAVSVAEKYYLGGVTLLPNGQEGGPTAILQAAMKHTDASIGKIVTALKGANLWNSTELILTAKHGQSPRVGSAGLISEGTLPNLLGSAGTPVVFAVQDDVSLLYLKDQSQTNAALQTLKNFKNTGTVDVYFHGVKQTLPASQVIDKILSGQGLVKSGLGNPANDATTPDFIVTFKPGYIWVSGNPATKFTFKNGEHGGFAPDDTHVALIVSGGALGTSLEGKVVKQHVDLKQVAVTVLQSLGLDAEALQGAEIEHTQALPGLGQLFNHGHGINYEGNSSLFPPDSHDSHDSGRRHNSLSDDDSDDDLIH